MSDDRKLATVRKVSEINPIPDADKIEVLTIDGWQVVAKKGDFKVGDLCIYFEIDSVLPQISYWEFMANRKFRIKTIKLRKQISQGLVIPISHFNQVITDKRFDSLDLREGKDITQQLGVVKYETPDERAADYQGLSKKKHNFAIKFLTRFSWYRKLTKTRSKSFPDWLSKTDEPRVENSIRIINDNKGKTFWISEKIEGQSGTYWYKKGFLKYEFGICSRTVRKMPIDGSNWSRVAIQLDIKNKLKKYCKANKVNIAIQGEVIAANIQGGIYHNVPDSNVTRPFDFFVFNVYDIDKKKYYSKTELELFCAYVGLKHVPYLKTIELPSTVAEIVELSKGESVLAKGVLREGIVIRSEDMSVSFKAVNPNYLLKYDL